MTGRYSYILLHGRGPILVADLPCYKGILGQLLEGLSPKDEADVCQSTTDFFKVSGLAHHGL